MAVSSPAHLARLGRERPIQRVTARADSAPNAKRLTPRPPMRCLRLGCVLQSSAPPTPQAIDPIEDAGGPSATRAREPLAEATKHRGCVSVGHEQPGKLALFIAFDEPYACRAWNDAQLVEPTLIVLPRYGPDATIHNG